MNKSAIILLLTSLLLCRCASDENSDTTQEQVAEVNVVAPKLQSIVTTSERGTSPNVTFDRFFNDKNQLVEERYVNVDQLYRTYEWDINDRLVKVIVYTESGAVNKTYTIGYSGQQIAFISRVSDLDGSTLSLTANYQGSSVRLTYDSGFYLDFIFASDKLEQLMEVSRHLPDGIVFDRKTYEYDQAGNIVRHLSYVTDTGTDELFLQYDHALTYDNNPNPHGEMVYPGPLLDSFLYTFERDNMYQIKRYNPNNYVTDVQTFVPAGEQIPFKMVYAYDQNGYVLQSINDIEGSGTPTVNHNYTYTN